MGWIIAFALAGLTFAGLYLGKRCSRPALELIAAALLVGLAGYAWQGSPDMPGNPVASNGAGSGAMG